MEDKFKNLEHGIKVLSSVAMQRKTSPLNPDDSYQNTVDSSINYIEGKYSMMHVFKLLNTLKYIMIMET